VYVKFIAVIVQHGVLLMSVWLEGRRSLRRAAKIIPDWIGQLIGAIGDAAQLAVVLERMQNSLPKPARVKSRRKHPSWFQLLTNPELLEYTPA
jgi:hypothetical protein